MKAKYRFQHLEKEFTAQTDPAPRPVDDGSNAQNNPDIENHSTTAAELEALHAQVLNLQHQMNVFLTDRMEKAKEAARS